MKGQSCINKLFCFLYSARDCIVYVYCGYNWDLLPSIVFARIGMGAVLLVCVAVAFAALSEQRIV